jgi:hypothetical protein
MESVDSDLFDSDAASDDTDVLVLYGGKPRRPTSRGRDGKKDKIKKHKQEKQIDEQEVADM